MIPDFSIITIWGTYWIPFWSTKVSNLALIYHSCIYFSCFHVGTASWCFGLFLVTPVYEGAIEGVGFWGNRAPVTDISLIIGITLCVKEVVILFFLVYFYIICLEETFTWDIICFGNRFPWVHNGFVLVMHEIFCAVL